eukprot:403360952
MENQFKYNFLICGNYKKGIDYFLKQLLVLNIKNKEDALDLKYYEKYEDDDEMWVKSKQLDSQHKLISKYAISVPYPKIDNPLSIPGEMIDNIDIDLYSANSLYYDMLIESIQENELPESTEFNFKKLKKMRDISDNEKNDIRKTIQFSREVFFGGQYYDGVFIVYNARDYDDYIDACYNWSRLAERRQPFPDIVQIPAISQKRNMWKFSAKRHYFRSMNQTSLTIPLKLKSQKYLNANKLNVQKQSIQALDLMLLRMKKRRDDFLEKRRVQLETYLYYKIGLGLSQSPQVENQNPNQKNNTNQLNNKSQEQINKKIQSKQEEFNFYYQNPQDYERNEDFKLDYDHNTKRQQYTIVNCRKTRKEHKILANYLKQDQE